MASRFELMLDEAGKFCFVLRGPGGEMLLRSSAYDGKIKAQTGVLHARGALRDPARSTTRSADGSHAAVALETDGSVFARSDPLATEGDAQDLLDRARKISDTAPVIDLTKARPQGAAS